MKYKINEKIQSLIAESIKTLRTNLSQEELQEVKSRLMDIHRGKFATSTSYFNMQKAGKLSADKEDKIEEAFYDIGSLIAIPHRGATILLKEVYKEEKPELPFIKYQIEVIGYVHEQVEEL